MTFEESQRYLFSLGNEVAAMKLGLENIRALLAALGAPQNKYLKVQVAGTNGKGSVCAIIGSFCSTSGLRTGVFTSPHLVSVTERVKVDGGEISEDEFSRHATRVREVSEKLIADGDIAYRPTFFEQITAIALLAFAAADVEVAVLETGLGGRLDATTAAEADVVAITNIDLDHQNYLGDTIAEIAAEKAAVIRPGVRVVAARQSAEAERVIAKRCRETGVVPTWATTDISAEVRAGADGMPVMTATFRTGRTVYADVVMGLRGRHQLENAAAAIGVAECLQDMGLAITREHVIAGIRDARHAGRLEYFNGVLLDGAHNAGGARALRSYLDEFVERPLTIVFGAMRDKDVAEIAAQLFPKANRLILTRADNSRSLVAQDLAAFVSEDLPRERLTLTGGVDEAISAARSAAPDNLILVTGSLYLVGEARKYLAATGA